jgi:DNA-directed RNA polymerase subunit omega
VDKPFPIEDLVDRVGNRYAIVVAVAKRVRQLKQGAKPFIDAGSHTLSTIALHEISAGYVRIEEPPPHETPEPAAPEVIEVPAGDAERLSAVIQSLDDNEEDEEDDEDDEDDEDQDDTPTA